MSINLGCVFLPFAEAVQVFDHSLKNPPRVNADLKEFLNYLADFWLPKLDMIECWTDEEPRTNNPAEAYHSTLQKDLKQ
jgi:hypothetical protein